jgi:hypothetical protein
MGRPLNKRYFGSLATADQRAAGTETQENIRAEANLTTTGIVDDAFIVAQKGLNKFILRNKAGDANSQTVCRMVNKATAALALGEMVLFGNIAGGTGNRIPLKKITARKAVDYDNNQYTWVVQDDSTETIIVLTAI